VSDARDDETLARIRMELIVTMFPKQFVIERMKENGLAFIGGFIVPMRPA